MMLELLTMTQEQLLDYVGSQVKLLGNNCIVTNQYIYVRNNDKTKPLLVSHMDTINDAYNIAINKNDIILKNNIISLKKNNEAACLGGDDRVGVYIMLEIMKNHLNDYDFLFTTNEEIGGLGAKNFIKDYPNLNNTCIIQIDRRGTNHVATYGYDNKNLLNILYDNYKLDVQRGSYTDAVDLSEITNIACFNLACGYYNNHTTAEYILLYDVVKIHKLLLNDNFIKDMSKQIYKCKPKLYPRKRKFNCYNCDNLYNCNECEEMYRKIYLF